MELNEIKTILNKLKNKEDFRSIIIHTKTAQIFLEREHIYFETNDKYHITADFYETNERQKLLDQTKEQAIDYLKQFELVKTEQ